MIAIVQKISTYIENLEEKKFQLYLGVFLSTVLVLAGFIIFYYYYQVHGLQQQIREVNDVREDIENLLTKAKQVQQQRAEVNALLEQDQNFKIRQYFSDLLTQLRLTDQRRKYETAQVDREDGYRESILTAEFVNMDMKQLTELLQELEQNPRISSKELDIKKSKKQPGTIEVKLTIGTLQPKTATTE